MNRPSDEEPMLDIARGDVALSKHLRNSLKLLKDKTDDPEFRRLVDDISSGRRSLREAASSDAFSRVLDPLVQRGAEEYRQLSEQERDELARIGEQQFEDLRKEEEQRRDRRNGPDDEDEDFSEQNWIR